MPPPEMPATKKAKTSTKAKAAPVESEAEAEPTSAIGKSVKKRGRPARAKADEVIEDAAEELMKPETVEPVQVDTVTAKTKKRGRPAKNAAPEPEVPVEETEEQAVEKEEEEEEEVKKQPKKRGRPAKKSTAKEAESEEKGVEQEETPAEPPKKRGRPSKKDAAASAPAPAKKASTRGRKPAIAKEPEPEAEEDVNEEDAAVPKQTRGRPKSTKPKPAAEEPATAPKKGRGRSKTVAVEEPVEEPVDESAEEAVDEPVEEAAPAPKKGRGRPKATVDEPADQVASAPKKGRGRPKNAVEEPAEEVASSLKKGRGRPKAAAKEPPAQTKPAPKKRGRPARNAEPVQDEDEQDEDEQVDGHPHHAHYHEAMDRVDDQIQEELRDAVSKSPPKKSATKSKPAAKKTKKDVKAQPANEEEEEETEIADGPNYWLMKAEPNSRIEKNADGEDVDVKFSIDDLRSKTQPEPWEGEFIKADNLPTSTHIKPGIRNLQAQKNLKAMKKGDLAFFYESSCKVPGIVGIMEIVEEASPDEAAFDRKSAYYDAKSKKAIPKWMLVHVQFKRKFPQKISLKDLQRFSKPGGTLENMFLMKQSRLSVSKVSKSEWDFVMKQLGDDSEEDEQVVAGEDEEPEDSEESALAAEDLGNDFARAFEAPANFGVAEEYEDNADEYLNEDLNGQDHQAQLDGSADDEPIATSPLPDQEDVINSVAPAVPSVEEPASEIIADYASAAAETAQKSGSGFLSTIGSALGLTKSNSRSPSHGKGDITITESTTKAAGNALHGLESAVESVEHIAESAAETIADAASSILPSPSLIQEKVKKVPARAASKARSVAGSTKNAANRASSRAPSVRASSRATSRAPSVRSGSVAPSGRSGRAGSKARETIGSITDAFKAQTDTIMEGADDDDDEASRQVALSDLQGGIAPGGDAISGANGAAPTVPAMGGTHADAGANNEFDDFASVDINTVDF